MKKLSTIFFRKIVLSSVLVLTLIFVFVFYSGQIAKADEEATKDKLSVSLSLKYVKSNGIKSVKVSVSRRENKRPVPVTGVVVNLYYEEVAKKNKVTGYGMISDLITDEEGEGQFVFTEQFQKLISGKREMKFIARMDSDPLYEDTEEEILVKEAEIVMKISDGDSVKKVSAKLTESGDSAFVPVADAELRIFIKRSFSLLPIGEEGTVTDEEGMVSALIPEDIPSDPDGKITLVARIEEHENFGTVETSGNLFWDVHPVIENGEGRTLWSSGRNAPVPLVVASVFIILVVWGTIVYLIMQVVKIRKIGKQQVLK